MHAFLNHTEQHYRRGDGNPSGEVAAYMTAARPLHELYGHAPVANFGPLALKAVRQKLIDANNCCRKTLKSRIRKS